MIFIVEGIDASGKTTLARCMADKFNCPCVHHTYDETWTGRKLLDHHTQFLFNYKVGDHIILDRSWPSCQIYGKIFRDNPDEIPVYLLAKIFQLLGVVYIYALPEYESWAKLYKDMCGSRIEMYDNDNRMVDVYDAFMDIARDSLASHDKTYTYDMHNDNMEIFVTQIVRAYVPSK